MVEIKLETGKNVTDLGKILLYLILGGAVVSAIFMAVMIWYFMFLNPLGT